MKTEVVTCSGDEILKALLLIDSKSFPEDWFYPDAEEYYQKKLEGEQNIKILLKNTGGIIGFSISIPHNEAVEELIHADPEIEKDLNNRYYIESFVILPEFRGREGLFKLGCRVIEELRERGISHISLHARVYDHNVSKFVQRKFTVTKIRRISEWEYYNYKQPADYIEATI